MYSMPTQRNHERALHVPLNTNNISLHEEAIKAFQKEEAPPTIHNLDQYQRRHRIKSKQNIAANNWTIEKRRLDDLESTVTKQLDDALQSLDMPSSQLLLSHEDDSSTGTGADNPAQTPPLITILARVESILSEYHSQRHTGQDQEQPGQSKDRVLNPAMVASCLIQARDELERIGGELESARKAAAADVRKAQLQITEALRADLNETEFPPQLQAKLDALKKSSLGIRDDDNDNNNNNEDGSSEDPPYISLEATIIERFAKVQGKYNEQISYGKNLDEATVAFKRSMQQATRWAMKQVEDAIARESSRREQATLAFIRKELKDECNHRLAQLREAREKAALVIMREEEDRRSVEEKKELEHAEQLQKQRAKTDAALLKWKETQHREMEQQRVEDCARKYQEELSRIERMRENGERVSYREKKLLQNMDEKRKVLEEAARAEELKYERLSRLAATVPYFDKILDVQANIHGTTVARENAAYHEDSTGLTAFQHGLSKLHSFTDDKIFSDRAFRLGHALHEKGISHTVAARDAVALCCPRERNPICDHST